VSDDASALLKRAAATEFYRDRVAQGTEWSRIPLTRRDDLVRDQLARPPFGRRRLPGAAHPVRVGVTGNGDDVLVLPWSERELALERAAGTRMLARLGVASGTAIANTLAGALAAPGSLLFGDVVEEHGALDVPLGAIESDPAAKQAWELVDRVTPSMLTMELATATRFLAAAPVASRPWLTGIVWLQRAPAASAAVEVPNAVGFAGWQRRWLSVAEAASFVASTCARGAFHADEGVRVEITDDAGSPLAAGDSGIVVVTPLEGESALLRYASGLRGHSLASRCGCGGGGTAFELIA